MKTWRWLTAVVVGWALVVGAAELELPRPGAVVVTALVGEARWSAGAEARPLRLDDRLRVGSTVVAGRKSLLTLALSNGIVIQLGPESELELEEFGQLPPPAGTAKYTELTAEPTLSRTRLRLVRGEVTVDVKPLQEARGSSFALETAAGVLRTGVGTLRARVRMLELGLGVCTVEVRKGRAEFVAVGRQPVRLAEGGTAAYALETDRRTGELKVGDMPPASAGKR
jgi:hypothetical protein